MTLDLDYRASAKPFPWAGAALLALSLAAAAQTAVYYRRSVEEAGYWEKQAGQAERSVKRETPLSPHDMQERTLEIKHANEVLGQITLPWDSLFQAVEGAAGNDVALLTIEPDAEKREVKISGEAKNIGAVLNYIAHLSAQETFSGVYLRSHEVERRAPGSPVRFALSIAWKMAP